MSDKRAKMAAPWLPRFNTIGVKERRYVMDAMEAPLSAFLAGDPEGGRYVYELERTMERKLGVTHAIACNSATSGLLAACAAVEVANEDVIVSPYTMSATAAAPVFLGAGLKFVDVEPRHYCLDPNKVAEELKFGSVKAVIATNLFGHPAELQLLNRLAHANSAYLIEDNAQSPFAMENNVYAGTVGDIGVFSFNVHKHIQSGEGGIVVTDNDDFADSIRLFINHGEVAGGPVGLNLRMTELAAAVVCAQLERSDEIIQSRIDLAESLIAGLKDNPIIKIHPPRKNCKHVYYALAMELHGSINRTKFIDYMAEEGVTLSGGYVAPLYRLPAFQQYTPMNGCSITEKLHDQSLMTFEICGYDPTPNQVRQIINAFARVTKYVNDYVNTDKYAEKNVR